MIKWIVINTVFSVLIYFGFYESAEGAKNLSLFIAWGSILSSIYVLTEDGKKSLAKTKRSVHKNVNLIFKVLVTAIFIWFGAWVTGLLYALHILVVEEARLESVKAKKEDL